MTDRKTQIIAAATALFLDEGLSVSTARIAKAAGVSNGTLFNAFPTKQALIDTIYKDAKQAMFASVPYSGTAPFTRKTLKANWDGYLEWENGNSQTRRVMHLLLDSGLTSAEAQAEIGAIASPHAAWMQAALDQGIIRGPSINFIGQLIFFYLDLVINERLEKAEKELAFDMLCTSIGLKK